MTKELESLIIKQPEYDCPTHGTVMSVVTFSSTIDYRVKRFCMKCCLEKMAEIGVCEVVEKKL
jgi:hypothetical protein